MREDFYLDFPGFGGCKSRCHIRILADAGKPVVVICSQLKTKPGTSIMNAYEIIRGRVYEYLAKKHSDRLKFDVAQKLEGLADTIEKTKKISVAIVVYMLRLAARAMTNRAPVFERINLEIPEVFWIEHWPEGTGLQSEVDYLLVTENEVGEPRWHRVEAAGLIEKLGYTRDDALIPEEVVE